MTLSLSVHTLDDMSDKRSEVLAWLDEQELRCSFATPGPWAPGERETECLAAHGGAGFVVLRRTNANSIPSPSDMAFISASRTALPLALAAIRGEIETHAPRREPDGWECADCLAILDGDAYCDTIERLHAATVGAGR